MGDGSLSRSARRRRFREPERRPDHLAPLAPLLLLALAVLLAPTSASAGPSWRWNFDLLAGHDDQALASQDLGVVAPVSEAYYTGFTRLRVRWSELLTEDRLDLNFGAGITAYGPKIDGADSDFRLEGAYRFRPSRHWALDATAGVWRYRRGADAIFDLDMLRLAAKAAYAPSERWLFAAGARYHRIYFPGRATLEDPEQREDQRQTDASLGVGYMFPGGANLGIEGVYRRTVSNEPTSEYQGPLYILRGGLGLPWRINLSGFAVFHRRDYRTAPAQAVSASGELDTLGVRRDDTWQFGVVLDRPIYRRLRLFLDVTYLDQVSNDEYYSYNQTRFALGVAVAIIPAEAREYVPGAPSSAALALAPTASPDGIRFRYRSAAARSVALVGGFNGWDASRAILLGPDPDGLWEITVPVPDGVWRYAFVVDGEWVEPQGAVRYEDDGFGGRNGVLEVPLAAGPGS